MKQIITIISLLFIFIGCAHKDKSDTKQTSGFNPVEKTTTIDFPATSNNFLDTMSYSHGIKLSVMVPSEFTQANQRLLQNKLMQIASRGGISALGGSPSIVIAPNFALLSEDVTTTPPIKKVAKYNVAFYIANIATGDVYGSITMDIMGVGDSFELALQNAISSISVNDHRFFTMIEEAEQRILAYYTENGDRIILQAQTAINNNQHDLAISLLGSIPIECGELYEKAQTALAPIYKERVIEHSEQALAKMKACLYADTPDNFLQAMNYYEQIAHDSPAKQRADALYDNVKSDLAAAEKQRLEDAKEQMEMEFKREQMSNAQEQELLKIKLEGDANNVLLEKYKKDLAYERLPWLRKLVHLGNLDPFDGTENPQLDVLTNKDKK